MVHLLNVAGCAAAACACWPEPVSSWCCDLWPRLVKTPFTWGWGWGGVIGVCSALLGAICWAIRKSKTTCWVQHSPRQPKTPHNNNNKFSIDNTSSSNNTNSAVSQVKCDADVVYFFFLILFWPHTTKSGSRRSGSRASFSWSCVKAAAAAAAVAAQLAVAESVSAAPSQSQSASSRWRRRKRSTATLSRTLVLVSAARQMFSAC